VPLGAALEQLIYFNGRFLKAEDLGLEQKSVLTRIALSERAQGAGVSYGFHVVPFHQGLPTSYVSNVATSVYDRMLKRKSEWTELFQDGSGELDERRRTRLADAIHEVCENQPGSGGDVCFLVGPGHAADGYGHDLYLRNEQKVRLAALIDDFVKAPLACNQPGPSITPTVITGGAPPLTGAFLLTVLLDGRDHGKVPVYGVQCTDNLDTACSYGFHADGVALKLVHFSALDGKVTGTDAYLWRGAGQRAYATREAQVRGSKLPGMTSSLPFSAAAEAPDTGTHVPIGVVYLQNGSYMAFDEWTSKRTREPAETSYWLRALTHPSRTSQLARVLQFEAQLTESLGYARSPAIGKSLWKHGFAEGETLVLPGVGFLPISVKKDAGVRVGAADLQGQVAAFFDGVPFELVATDAGELNALFVGALESPELRLTRPAPIEDDDPHGKIIKLGQLLDRYRYVARESFATVDRAPIGLHELIDTVGKLVKEPAKSDLPAQVKVWYLPDAFPGWVMFTWPGLGAEARTLDHVPLCVSTEFIPILAMYRYSTTTVNARAAVVVPPTASWRFREGEPAGPPTFLDGPEGADPLYVLSGLKLEVEPPVPGLGIEMAAQLQAFTDNSGVGSPVPVFPGPDGFVRIQWPDANTESPMLLTGFRVWLTGADRDRYDVRYRGNFRLFMNLGKEGGDGASKNGVRFATSVTVQNGAMCDVAAVLPGVDTRRLQLLSLLESIVVEVMPRGCPTGEVPGPSGPTGPTGPTGDDSGPTADYNNYVRSTVFTRGATVGTAGAAGAGPTGLGDLGFAASPDMLLNRMFFRSTAPAAAAPAPAPEADAEAEAEEPAPRKTKKTKKDED
jgi:hypothetical protein